MFWCTGLRSSRSFILGIVLLAGPLMAEAAPPATPLAGTYSGLTVQCNGAKPEVRKGSKGAFKNFNQYRAAALKDLQKKMKGKKKAAIKAAAATLTTDLNKLERTLIEKCEDTNGLCFNPRIRVLFPSKTSRCLPSMDAFKVCNKSTMRCTQSVPGSCSCDGVAEPATPTPTPVGTTTPTRTATPTPTPTQGGGGSGSPIGGNGPINGITINLQSTYVGTSHTLYVNNLSGGAAGASLNSFFSSISENGIISGGYYVRPTVETNIPGIGLWSSTGLHRDDEANTMIIPFLEYKGKVHEACSLNYCTKGYVLKKVNESGIAIGNFPRVFNSPKNTFDFIPEIGKCSALEAIDVNSSNVVLVEHHCDGDTAADRTMYNLYTPQGRFEMNHKALRDAHESIFRVRALDSLKEYLRYINACSEEELNGIVLGKITSPPDFEASGMNNLGDVFGFVSDFSTKIEYAGTCGEGEWSSNGTKPVPAFWVVRRDGTITFLDEGLNWFFRFGPLISYWEMKARMNDRRVMVFDGRADTEDDVTYPLASSAAQSGSDWKKVPLVPATYGYKRSLAINNQNEVVGYGLQSEIGVAHPFKKSHAIASLRSGALDLNNLIPGSDWVLTRADDINDCGEIVGLAYNTKLDLFRGFLLSPKGCR